MASILTLNQSYANKRTKFKVTSALQKETQQVRTVAKKLKLFMVLSFCTVSLGRTCIIPFLIVLSVNNNYKFYFRGPGERK